VLVLDNASYHKQLDIREQMSNYPMSSWSSCLLGPDFNLIELVWHSCGIIAHRLFKSVNELRDLLEKLLNQGELIIKWQRRVKIKVIIMQLKCTSTQATSHS